MEESGAKHAWHGISRSDDKMNVITDMLETSKLARKWAGTHERTLLLSALRTAAEQAKKSGHAILASFTQPVEWFDPIHVLMGARISALGESFYWEQPAQATALIGVGAAYTIETCGPSCFSDAATAWRALMAEAIATYTPEVNSTSACGPLLLGGFAFDPLQPRTELWAGFPDGLLILPRLLFSYTDGQVALTVNRMVEADENIEACANELIGNILHLLTAIETIPFDPSSSLTEELITEDSRPAEEWMHIVAETAQMIRNGVYEKVVLARSVQVTNESEHPFDIGLTLHRLRQSYPGAYVFAIERAGRFFVGATPERLVQAQDGQIQTTAVAGSARRGTTREDDEQIGKELLQSQKNQIEHSIVVTTVQEALLQHCSNVHVLDTPRLLKLKNVQHLETPIVGELRSGKCILDVMADLHPTPAVGGFPRQAALEAIRTIEKLDRGWYASPVGWIGTTGHGEFAVALRSGLISGNQATLFAGCGIVGDSDPQAEYAESCLKLQVMLRGLDGK